MSDTCKSYNLFTGRLLKDKRDKGQVIIKFNIERKIMCCHKGYVLSQGLYNRYRGMQYTIFCEILIYHHYNIIYI